MADCELVSIFLHVCGARGGKGGTTQKDVKGKAAPSHSLKGLQGVKGVASGV